MLTKLTNSQTESVGRLDLDGFLGYMGAKKKAYDILNVEKASLEIVGNKDDFDMRGMEAVDYELKDIPDPIVLQPVFHNGAKHYLIVTAWGEEASDSKVVNQVMN